MPIPGRDRPRVGPESDPIPPSSLLGRLVESAISRRLLARVLAIPPGVAGAYQRQVHIGTVEHERADQPIVAVALVPVDGQGLAGDQLRESALGLGPEGLLALWGVNAGEAHALGAPIGIEHLDGVAVEDADDLTAEGIGMGWWEEREGQEKEGEEQTKG